MWLFADKPSEGEALLKSTFKEKNIIDMTLVKHLCKGHSTSMSGIKENALGTATMFCTMTVPSRFVPKPSSSALFSIESVKQNKNVTSVTNGTLTVFFRTTSRGPLQKVSQHPDYQRCSEALQPG